MFHKKIKVTEMMVNHINDMSDALTTSNFFVSTSFFSEAGVVDPLKSKWKILKLLALLIKHK